MSEFLVRLSYLYSVSTCFVELAVEADDDDEAQEEAASQLLDEGFANVRVVSVECTYDANADENDGVYTPYRRPTTTTTTAPAATTPAYRAYGAQREPVAVVSRTGNYIPYRQRRLTVEQAEREGVTPRRN